MSCNASTHTNQVKNIIYKCSGKYSKINLFAVDYFVGFSHFNFEEDINDEYHVQPVCIFEVTIFAVQIWSTKISRICGNRYHLQKNKELMIIIISVFLPENLKLISYFFSTQVITSSQTAASAVIELKSLASVGESTGSTNNLLSSSDHGASPVSPSYGSVSHGKGSSNRPSESKYLTVSDSNVSLSNTYYVVVCVMKTNIVK